MREVRCGDIVVAKGFPVDDFGIDVEGGACERIRGEVVAIHWDLSQVTLDTEGTHRQFRTSDILFIEGQTP